MKIMAIDYGDARTGIAFSDISGMIAGETLVVEDWNAQRLAEKLAELYKSRNAGKIVLGCPVNMDGTRGPRAEKSEAMGEMLRELTGAEVIMIDERRTTVDAHRILSQSGKKMKKHKAVVDAVAATLILETYLNSAH
ncbi:MAG: Holliday junction resolvase RuvX [Oscillospiraceae bacterium]|nr:Holliday junction resolvase RuvX [Oscillospiraceae bacterium]